ncbi:HAD-IIB family hydrolase [Palleronia sediminis]|uniref:HAD-IIB family hydrolase n=1 Tax=Palleronia sediminis TaxID=2547833 RepID=UPI001F0CF741|nr:HAD-IIB family hydrolase [Palleronia sediminis]
MHIALGGCLKAPPTEFGVTEDTGGHIAYVLGAACAQARRGAEVSIVTRAIDDPSLSPAYAAPVETVAPRCTIRRLVTGTRGYLCKDALEAELPALTEALLALLRDAPAIRPDVIHAHFADAAELAAAAERAFGIPWLYSSHSLARDKCASLGGGDPALERRLARERRAIAGAGAIVASSRDEAERQVPAYDAEAEGRVHRVNPGILGRGEGSAARARRWLAPFLRDATLPAILAVARPIRKKNLGALVEAYARTEGLRDRANLVIVAGLRNGLTGGCPEQDAVIADLFDRVDRHDLWGRVALPRRHDGADIADLYALAAEGGVFCNPALHEPFGLTLIEAAQAGAPLVATRNGGPVDILRSLGAGKLVDPESPEAIGRAIAEWLGDDLRPSRARAARAKAHALFDWDRWAERAERIAAPLVARTPVPARSGGTPRHLVACDIDGTLTGDHAAAARFADWAACRADDTMFAVATGRSLPEARRVLADWDLPQPDLFVTSCGTEIWRRSGAGRLTRDTGFAATLDWPRAQVAAALEAIEIEPQTAYEQRPWKLSYYGDETEAARVRAALAGMRGLRVVASHGRFIDVMPAAAGKAAAVSWVARRAGVAPEHCVVAGDSGNDADMLAAFPRAILPANALPDLDGFRGGYRGAAPFADGVLEGLARFGLAPATILPREVDHA